MKKNLAILVFAAIAALMMSGCDDIQKVLFGSRGPAQVISFGLVRPVSCRYEGNFVGGAGYECVMRNHSDSFRETNVECASFDAEGRMMGRPKNGAGLTRIVLNGGEERIGRLYFDPNAALAACFDFENSVPTYNEIIQLRSDPKMLAANLVSELPL